MNNPSWRSSLSGYQLVELLVVCAIVGLFALVATPPLARLASRMEVEQAAQEVGAALHEARAFAIRHSAKVGVKFRTAADGRVWWALYRDGDGDGVRNDDIVSGVDPQAAAARTLERFGQRIHFGFPAGPAPSDPSDRYRHLDRLDDPIRFNRSDIASFSPLQGATPGSIYVTDGERQLYAVRVDSRAGRPHIIHWNPDERIWN